VIHLEIPKKLRPLAEQARLVASAVFRPISRKYDTAEHAYPKELDLLAALLDGINDGGAGASASGLSRAAASSDAEVRSGAAGRDACESGGRPANRNGTNMAAVIGMMEICRGDVGLALSIPRQGLGNAAISAVGTPEQRQKYKRTWVAMAITEPSAGSDSAAIRTTARLDGDSWVIDGEKIFVTAGERAGAVVVWASLDPTLGRAAIKPFVVEKGTRGLGVLRLDHKLGIRASDTATLVFDQCRVPKDAILGSPEIDTKRSFAGVMRTFDNTRPVVAAMAIGVARAALERTRELCAREGVSLRDERSSANATALEAELLRLEAEVEVARLLTLKAAWMADNGRPNALEASMAKAKAGRTAVEVTLRCVELCGSAGYGEGELLEKWARDSKILDIFEGTQQIQMLIVARAVLGKTSAELR
jgi:acyl-CoA dehydrogenase